MANKDFGRDLGSGGGFALGLLAGTVLGAILGLLFAPKSGAAFRGDISERAGALADMSSESLRRATASVSDLADRGSAMMGQAQDAVATGTDEARRYASAAVGPRA